MLLAFKIQHNTWSRRHIVWVIQCYQITHKAALVVRRSAENIASIALPVFEICGFLPPSFMLENTYSRLFCFFSEVINVVKYCRDLKKHIFVRKRAF